MMMAQWLSNNVDPKLIAAAREIEGDWPIGIRSEQSDEGPIEVLIHGVIGDPWDELDSSTFAQFLSQNDDRDIHLRVNSPGGSVFDGIAIHSALDAHNGRVTATIEGYAASAASFVVLPADEITIVPAATMMLHRAHAFAIGNVAVMLEMAEVLEKIDGQIAGLYAEATGKSRATAMEWMTGPADRDGTWFTAEEALTAGLVDSIRGAKDDDDSDDDDDEDMETAHYEQQLADRKKKMAQRARMVRARLVAIDATD
jgi:ATP-dependent protease ClpP protease subunit